MGKLKLFKCDHCQKGFSTHTIIDVHRRRVHLNERLNPCEECNLTFATERNLSRHRNLCHIDVNATKALLRGGSSTNMKLKSMK